MIDLLKKTIAWKPLSKESLSLAQVLITGRILGLLLPHLEPTLLLHGCVLVVNGGGVGLLGPRGMGKSTLAASLLRRGLSLLSDDLMVIQKRRTRWIVQPGPPEIRLWPDTANMLVKQEVKKTEVLYPTTKKKRILLSSKGPLRSWDRPVPLKALFILLRRRKGGVRLEPLRGKKAFLEILHARYNQIPERSEILKDQFRIAAELIRKVSINQITYSSGFRHLEKITETILKTVSS